MSQMGPKKSALKFKGATLNLSKNSTKPMIKQSKSNSSDQTQRQAFSEKNIQKGEQTSGKHLPDQKSYKTKSEQAYDIAKKHRTIHKLNDKSKTTNRERIQKMNKQLSRLPDHFDLSKTGEKIQKGY